MKVTKKEFIMKTLMFIFVVFIAFVFRIIFGSENTIVGIIGIIAALSLISTDYTINPVKNTIYFILIELTIGIAAYIASLNPILGLIVTFLVIFSVLYNFTYSTKNSTYTAFTLGYLFMLYGPVKFIQLPSRLAGLVFCGILIMAVQMIFNKNKLKKSAQKIIQTTIKTMKEEINTLSNGKNLEQSTNSKKDIYTNLRDLQSNIYERIDRDVQLPVVLTQTLFISMFLESCNLTLDKIKNEDKGYNKILNYLDCILDEINKYIQKNTSIEEILEKLDRFTTEVKNTNTKYYLVFELQTGVSILKDNLINANEEYTKQLKEKYSIKHIVNKLNELKNNINKESLKFTFALRGAIVISLGVGIVSILNLKYGKWLVCSSANVVQPYLETSEDRGRNRIIGTILGLVVFETIFFIFKGEMQRSIIILTAGYLSIYVKDCKYRMIFTTTSSLGIAAITGNVETISIERLIMVFIGTGIALYANKLILPYKMSEITKKEVRQVTKLNEKILEKVYDLEVNNKSLGEEFKNLIIINELDNKKISLNNKTLASSKIDDFLYNQRIFINKTRFLMNTVKKCSETIKDKTKLLSYINNIIKNENTKEDKIGYLKSLDDIISKIILVDIVKLKENIEKSKELINQI